MKQRVLVVAAHPDDEILGLGGTVARHAQAGDAVHTLILAQGFTSRGSRGQNFSKELSALRSAALRANRLLGVRSVDFAEFPDNRMDSLNLLDVVKRIEAAIQKYQPSVLYTHHAGDVNIDHRVAQEAVIAACRPQPGHPVSKLLFFETPSSTEWQVPDFGTPFTPNWFVDISKTLPRKLSALRCYAGELRPWPHARSLRGIESLARWRGATVGVAAAEAFVMGRRIVR